LHNAGNYRLSIQINPDGFSFLITDDACGIHKLNHNATGSYAGTFLALKEDVEFLPLTGINFKQVKLILNTHRSTLIPQNLFDVELQDFIFSLNHPVSGTGKLFNNLIPEFQITILYEVEAELLKILGLFKNHPEISHSSCPYLTYLKSKFPNPEGIFVNIAGGLLTLTQFDQEALLYHNIIPISGETDIIYHILNACRQFSENSCNQIFLSGTTTENSESMRQINKYIPHIVHLRNELPFELAWDLNENYFTNLLAASNCV
jgi:hypothetical protein